MCVGVLTSRRMNRVCFVVLVTVASLNVLNAESPFGAWPDKCLDGPSQKEKPTIETGDFAECKSWENKRSCCTAEMTQRIKENGTYSVNFLRDICGPVSAQCERFFLDDECFYECEPMMQYYRIGPGLIQDLPLCARFCDAWFDACKDDKTCIKDFATELYINPESRNCSSDGSNCITFAEMYGNGKGLCEGIYISGYVYETSNKNCMVYSFTGENPNLNGDPYKEEKKENSAGKMTTSLLKIHLAFFSVCLFVF